jgi:histidinol-phosphate aminotransferase
MPTKVVPLPAAVRAGIAAAVADVPFHRYPDGGARDVTAALSGALTRHEGLGLILGNGSDELIQIIALALARPGAVMLAPEPTFVMYRVSALLAGMRFVGVPLAPGFGLDIDGMEAAIARERRRSSSSPRQTTRPATCSGRTSSGSSAPPRLVVVDEATGHHVRELPDAHPGVSQPARAADGLQDRTRGAAARLRGGCAGVDRRAREVRQPVHLNALTQAAAQVVLREARCSRSTRDDQSSAGGSTRR